MGKFIITEREKKNIRDLYSLNEDKDSTYGLCNGKNSISEPFIYLGNVKKSGLFKTIPFRLKISFPTTGSSTQSFKTAIKKLGDKIKKSVGDEEGYTIILTKINTSVGSASNYLNGPLQPKNSNNGSKLSDASLKTDKNFTNLPDKTTSQWKKNEGYAIQRVSKLIEFLKTNGKNYGFKVSNEFKRGSDYIRITDTGGCKDEERDTSNYPKDGQFVDVTGEVKLEPTVNETVLECSKGMGIIIGYFRDGMDVKGFPIPSNNANHNCDAATFSIYGNGQLIGFSNMNNNTVYKGASRVSNIPSNKLVGTNRPNHEYFQAKKAGGTVYTIITPTEQQLKRISSGGGAKNGEIKLTMKGTPNTTKTGKYHGEAPMVCVYTQKEGEERKIIYGPLKPFADEDSYIPGNTPKTLGIFNPCKPK